MTIQLTTPEPHTTISQQTPIQQNFSQTASDPPQESFDYLHLHRQGEDCSHPAAVTFTWQTDNPQPVCTLHLSPSETFVPETTYQSTEGTVTVPNLYTDTTYYWKVTAAAEEAHVAQSPVWRFTTAEECPRWMFVDGLSNVRDMGGWHTRYGKIRQGLVYRGSEMEFHHTLTERGRETMRYTMGIRTDLDLRGEAVGKIDSSAIGCEHALIPCAAYGDFLKDKETCRRIFALLAEEERYPVYFHCWGGADRTGTVAFLLGGLLGMSTADLYRDYTLTSLSIWGERKVDSPLFRGFVEGMAAYGFDESDVYPEAACRAFLADCGVTDAEMERIKEILLTRV